MLTVIEIISIYIKNKKKRKAVCRCECGSLTTVFVSDLCRNKIKACGCYNVIRSKGSKTHGKTESSEYVSWANMLQR